MAKKYEIKECAFCKQEKKIEARGWCTACYGRWKKHGTPEYRPRPKKKACIIDDCEKFAVSHGYCDMHRKRLAKHGSLEQTRPNDWGNREKHPMYSLWCNQKRFRGAQLCKEWIDDFWVFVEEVDERPSKNHYFHPIDEESEINKDNYHWVERSVSNNEDRKAYLREWARLDRVNNPDKYKDKNLRRYYGIGLEEFRVMEKEQDGKCKICGNPETALDPKTKEPRDLAVDHCHTKGHVRGLLCAACNTAIGLMKDDIKIMEKAITYLKT